ncbi:hypothetical protein [Mesorhizobium sp. M0701]
MKLTAKLPELRIDIGDGPSTTTTSPVSGAAQAEDSAGAIIE